MEFLIKLWNEVGPQEREAPLPGADYTDLDLVLRTMRDLFTARRGQARHRRSRRVRARPEVRRGSCPPSRPADRALRQRRADLRRLRHRDRDRARRSSARSGSRSGGYLIIDQVEALTAIDVNTGRFVGKKNLEDTITKINLEAAKEIADQLRLRNIGGIIVVDFIDMDKPQNRGQGLQGPAGGAGARQAKTNVLTISELGLVEMTRKRVRESPRPHAQRALLLLRGQGLHQERDHRGLRDLPRAPPRGAELQGADAGRQLQPRGGQAPPDRGARRAAPPHGPLQQDHPGEAQNQLPPGAVRHLRPQRARRGPQGGIRRRPTLRAPEGWPAARTGGAGGPRRGGGGGGGGGDRERGRVAAATAAAAGTGIGTAATAGIATGARAVEEAPEAEAEAVPPRLRAARAWTRPQGPEGGR